MPGSLGYKYPKGTHWTQKLSPEEKAAHIKKVLRGRRRNKKLKMSNNVPPAIDTGARTGNDVPAYVQGLAAKLAEMGKADWAAGYLSGYRDAKRGV